ncbi:MAG TPA: hypothetical protein VK680_08035 [Solirubrobacteraceae bacterium]|nr:hypothetical protein [Solirubrobacteraceae bacterium]
MGRSKIRRAQLLGPLALASAALALPLASQAAPSTKAPTSSAPSASTGGVTRVLGTSAILQGTVDPHNLATTYYFKYGPTIAYGSQTTPADLPAGIVKVKVSQPVTGLLVGYHYRLVASNSAGVKEGHDHIFTNKTKKKKTAFVLPKTFKPIPLGGTFILSGSLTGAGDGSREIVLQESPYPFSAIYTDVGVPILTTAAGHFTFSVPHMTESTKFRLSTVGALPVRSLIIPVQVSVRVTLKARSSGRSGLVRLYGTVTPAEVGARIFFEYEKPPKTEGTKGEKPTRLERPKRHSAERSEEKGPRYVTKFLSVVKPGTKSISRFSAVVSVKETGHYRAVVEVRPGPLASGASSTVLLHAPASVKKQKKKK